MNIKKLVRMVMCEHFKDVEGICVVDEMKNISDGFSKDFINDLCDDIIYHTDAVEQGGWMNCDESESESIKNVKRFINNIFKTEWVKGGLKNIPNTVRLYRVIFLSNKKKLNANFLGHHWVRDEKLAKTHIADMMGQLNQQSNQNKTQYMIMADFNKDDIDVYHTILNNVYVDHEDEVTVKKNAKPISYQIVKF